jgi:hypothetical protein
MLARWKTWLVQLLVNAQSTVPLKKGMFGVSTLATDTVQAACKACTDKGRWKGNEKISCMLGELALPGAQSWLAWGASDEWGRDTA